MDSSVASTREKWAAAGQGHVFDEFDCLSETQQTELLQQLNSIDVDLVGKIYQELASRGKATPASVEPFSAVVHRADVSETDKERWTNIGYKEIAEGHVAVLTLAGGQGTRLGTDAPKGTYDIGLPSHSSLYKFQGERLAKLQRLVADRLKTPHEVVIPWYVMTSFATDKPTREHFESHKYFGLKSENIFFFNQDLFPCVFEDGKVIMEGKSSISVAPNGNGGLWSAMVTQGVLADLERRGITLVCTYPVDNILTKVADPEFVGFCIEKKADVACKVVAKAYPQERVGVLALKDKRPAVIEYSEIAEEQSTATDPKTGMLLYNASHIVLNNFSIDFIRKLVSSEEGGRLHKLPFHIAKKQIPYWLSSSGSIMKDKYGWKFELFVFDVFEFAENMQALEVLRDQEFSPLKNSDASDSDNPTTCRKHLSALHKSWIEKAGGKVVASSETEPIVVEISPTISYDGEGLESLVAGKTFTSPVYIL